jgi:anti-sigma-K factor RskA
VLRAAQGGEPAWLIQEARDASLLVTPLQPVEVPPGMRLLLWTRLDPAAGMVALGPVPGGASARLPPAAVPFLAGGQFFGISLEPVAGDADASGPTGAMLYAGRIVQPPRAGAPAAADQP